MSLMDFGREVCGEWDVAKAREWLVTNGIGGYGMGTISGVHTRRYHGLLIAPLHPPVARTLLLSKLDEAAEYDGSTYLLHANRQADRSVKPQGFKLLERFHLEGAVPVWTFACADALLQKRVWMEQGFNTTYVQYTLARASKPLRLRLDVLASGRDHHWCLAPTDAHRPQVKLIANGLELVFPKQVRMTLQSATASAALVDGAWQDLFLGVEKHRGLDDVDHVFKAGVFSVELQPGATVTLVASTEEHPDLDGMKALDRRHQHEATLLRTGLALDDPPWVRQLLLAADQFIVRRKVADDPDGRSVIAGYPWFEDWGRDTMISLPGLTLATGRTEIARKLLRTFARFVDQGMLPNRFTEWGETPDYNTVDATLWYFEAIRAYLARQQDLELLKELFPILQGIIDWHVKGTRFGIRVDEKDGLVCAGEAGVQLTWMDAKVGDWVVTPRAGKPVEISALWYNALNIMADFARQLKQPAAAYQQMAGRTHQGFARFWNAELQCCYDVLDIPGGGADAAVRPNQLFAASLPHSPLSVEQRRCVVDICARQLLTSHGLRSLAPGHPSFIGKFGGDQKTRDAAYHQGTVWGWLIGPFISAHLRVYHDPDKAASFLMPLVRHLPAHCVGSVSEIFEGNAPFAPRGCIAQAWSVGEMLRVWRDIRAATGGGRP